MERTFSEALKNRRTYYSITDQSPIPDQEIECIINLAVRHVPSAFNSQSTRVVLLLGKSHKKLWNIVKDALRKIVPGEAFAKTEEKIDNSFACGYGTVLFRRWRRGFRKLSRLIRRISPDGHYKPQRCISWLFGSCLKMWASVLPCNIIIR